MPEHAPRKNRVRPGETLRRLLPEPAAGRPLGGRHRSFGASGRQGRGVFRPGRKRTVSLLLRSASTVTGTSL